MRLLVLSDSHGDMTGLRLAVQRERPDAVVHLGDHALDAYTLAQEFSSLSVAYVRGNCDGPFPSCADTYSRRLAGVQVFAAHGHRYGVKNGLLRFHLAAQENGASLALFGHTHVPYCQEENGIWLVNPGACRGLYATYAVITLEDGTVRDCRISEVYNTRIC